ncbi:type III PLP-dependent enzyme [Streptacidiphilus sp. PB12-B1b]|uniref:type III PLP-dependent enzyme n=1 Tax=Streptacidiphilus sp. PB12-B1b TaxID=2705012 RepID=UPI0015FE1272|nr:type III PLP-dependent enzyme [Streptacidiphilus sp. PB12-B1b]QMU78281.1 type III PLP-dependent enzyme [Streptacidiphilus sp. PB12-B1b]
MRELTDLAERFGTPLYVYRLDRVHRAVADLRAALPRDTRLYYSLKANPHPAIVAELAALGLSGELSSTGELASAIRAGLPPERCLYTGPGKTSEEMLAAVKAGIRLFSVESRTDRDRLADVARASGVDVDYMVRLNGTATAGSGLRMTGRPSQFGIDVDQTAELAAVLTGRSRARPVGAHVFAATNVSGVDALLAEFDLSARTAARAMESMDSRPEFVDLGGGFAAPFAQPGERTDYSAIRAGLERSLDAWLPGWRSGEPRVGFESGRYLVADSGFLLATVLDVKRSHGTTYAVLDAGVNVLGGMWGLGRLPTPSARPEPVPGADGTGRATLVGPLCTPLDVLGRAVDVSDLSVGLVLSIPNVGAYGLTASLLGFLSRPVPTEVVLDAHGEIADVRRLELRQVERADERAHA